MSIRLWAASLGLMILLQIPAPGHADQKSEVLNNFVDAFSATGHCQVSIDQPKGREYLKSAWADAFSTDSLYDVVLASVNQASFDSIMLWTPGDVAKSCSAIMSKFGPNGTVAKGLLTGSGKPK